MDHHRGSGRKRRPIRNDVPAAIRILIPENRTSSRRSRLTDENDFLSGKEVTKLSANQLLRKTPERKGGRRTTPPSLLVLLFIDGTPK